MIKQQRVSQFYSWLLAAIIFLTPTNLFLKFWLEQAYVKGLLVDYLIPKFYLSDVIILLLVGGWVVTTRFKFKRWLVAKNIKLFLQKNVFLLLLTSILIGKQFFTTYPLAAGWFLLKIVEFGLLIVVLWKIKNKISPKIVFTGLTLTLIFQSLLGIFQFHTQGPLYGFPFLGETNLANFFGIATGIFGGVENRLPYGTTAHPNILGGVLVIFWLLAVKLVLKKKIQLPPTWKYLFWFTTPVVFYCLYLTQSISAWLSLIIGLVLISKASLVKKNYRFFGWWLTGLILVVVPGLLAWTTNIYPNIFSLDRRYQLNLAAIKMFIANPWTGVGLNNFTAHAENFHPNSEIVRFVQPVHNIGWLWLSEAGLVGAGMITLLVKKFKESIKNKKLISAILNHKLLILLPIITLDHYLISQQTGLLLITLYLSTYHININQS